MTKRIVFVGNCQLDALRNLYDRFVGGATNDVTSFLPSWTEIDHSGVATLAGADLIVNQLQSFSGELELPEPVARIPRVAVPLVSASFLWPFGGAAHPSNADSPFLKGGPYPGELGDGFLNRLIRGAVPAEQALEQYRQHDLGGSAALDRRYELLMDQQRMRDEATGFLIASEIEANFRKEPLFLSPHHPGLRVTRALAVQCFQKMGAPQERIELLASTLNRSPFPQVELPMHPAVARHFGLQYGGPGTDYYWHGEGRFTWDEWVLRYMGYDWNPPLFEGWTIASAQPREARALLAEALDTLPHSPLAHAGMAKALQALNDLEPALQHAAEALRLSPQDPELARIGAFIASGLGRTQEAVQFARVAAASEAGNVDNLRLLAKLQEDARDFEGAAQSRREAVGLQPGNSEFVTDLGTTLAHLDRLDDALSCYQRASALATGQAGSHFGASQVLARLGRTEESILEAETALRLRPGIAAYFSHYGHMLLRAGRRDDGIAAFRKALDLDPGNAGIRRLLADLEPDSPREGQPSDLLARARLLAGRWRTVEAIKAYAEAIALAPANRTLRTEVAALYARMDRWEETATHLRLAIDPGEPASEATMNLCAALLRMGRLAEARQLADQSALAPASLAVAHRPLTPVDSAFMAVETSEIVPSLEFTAPACVQYTNFTDLNPIFGAHHIDHLYVEKRRWVPAVSLCRLAPGARLAVPNGEEFIAIAGSVVVAEQIRRDWSEAALNDAVASCTRHGSINEPAVLIGRYGIRTWGHWLGELLPKVVAVESKWPGRFRYVLPDRFEYDPVHTTAVQSLQYYGIGKDRLLLVPPGTIFKCSDLHVVTSAWSADRMVHPRITELLRVQGEK